MLHFAVYTFVEEYSQMITGKTNVKSQNCQANKLRSSPVPEVILTEPLSSISISSASTGKRKRPPVMSEVLVGNDANLPIYINKKTGKTEPANIVRKILSTKNNKRVKQRSMQDVIAMMANPKRQLQINEKQLIYE